MFNWQTQKLNEQYQREMRMRAEQMRLAQELRNAQNRPHELREQRQAERTIVLAMTPA